MDNSEKNVCIVGASGLLGSNVLKEALARGYKVNGTVRDVNAPDKATFLNALPNADQNLRLFESEMADAESFDSALSNVDCVKVIFFPIEKENKDLLDKYKDAKGKFVKPSDHAPLVASFDWSG